MTSDIDGRGVDTAPWQALSVLAFFAAVVPILGSLYVGLSFLTEQHRLAHEERVRKRIRPLIDERYERDKLRAERRAPNGQIDYDELMKMRAAYERELLKANGVVGQKTLGEHDLEVSMSRPVLPAVERRRQWVLLLTSAAGLALLAFDALPVTG